MARAGGRLQFKRDSSRRRWRRPRASLGSQKSMHQSRIRPTWGGEGRVGCPVLCSAITLQEFPNTLALPHPLRKQSIWQLETPRAKAWAGAGHGSGGGRAGGSGASVHRVSTKTWHPRNQLLVDHLLPQVKRAGLGTRHHHLASHGERCWAPCPACGAAVLYLNATCPAWAVLQARTPCC